MVEILPTMVSRKCKILALVVKGTICVFYNFKTVTVFVLTIYRIIQGKGPIRLLLRSSKKWNGQGEDNLHRWQPRLNLRTRSLRANVETIPKTQTK
jgi:hypothetical protein